MKTQDVDVDIEHNVLTVKAERLTADGNATEMLAAERPRGVFSRQLFLGDNLDPDRVKASYDTGVLRLTIPIAEQAKPRKIEIAGGNGQAHAITPDQGRHEGDGPPVRDSGALPTRSSRITATAATIWSATFHDPDCEVRNQR